MKKTLFGLISLATLVFLAVQTVTALPFLKAERESFPNLGAEVSVNLSVFFDPENTPMSGPLTKNYGSKVSFADQLPGAELGYVFSFWVVNGFVRQDLPYNHQFVITENLDLTAVYRPATDEVVCFMDSNQKLIKWQYSTTADPFTSADVPSIAGYSKPGLQLAALPWGSAIDFNSITSDTIVMLHYDEVASPNTYAITVNNGTGGGTYDFGSVITVVAAAAPEGQNFSYWRNPVTDEFVSLLPSYSFTVCQDITLEAMYSTDEYMTFPTVFLSDPLYLRDGKTTFVGQILVPEGYELIEYGLTVSDYSDYSMRYQASYLNPDTGEFVMSIPSVWGQFANIYMVYLIEGESPMKEKIQEENATSLVKIHPIISEYGEAGGNKWLEIYNPSDIASIDLSDYSLKLYVNGATASSQSLTLSGILTPGDVFVLANGSSSDSIKSQADLLNATVINFNGDDAIGIFYQSESSPIDLLGIPNGTDPGTSWPCGDGSTEDHTLIRNVGINLPASTWTTSEWSVLEMNDISKLGFHENQNPTQVGWTGSLSVMAGNTIQLSATYQPLDAIRGVTWSVINNAPTDGSGDVLSVDSNGLVTGLEAGTAMVVCTSTANGDLYAGSMITVTAPVYYSFSFDSNGGTSVTSQSILSGHTATEPEAPTKDGYTFSGWYLDDDTFLNQYNFSSLVSSEFTLHAKWIEEASLSETMVYSTGWEDISKSSYATGNVTSSSIVWTLEEALVGATTSDRFVDTKSIRTRNDAFVYSQTGWANLTKITFQVANYGSDTGSSVQVSVSKDGTNWISVLSATAVSGTTLTEYTVNLVDNAALIAAGISSSDQLRVKFTFTGTNDKRVNLDQVKVYGLR